MKGKTQTRLKKKKVRHNYSKCRRPRRELCHGSQRKREHEKEKINRVEFSRELKYRLTESVGITIRLRDQGSLMNRIKTV